jgi:hypothetical protein
VEECGHRNATFYLILSGYDIQWAKIFVSFFYIKLLEIKKKKCKKELLKNKNTPYLVES